MNLYIQLKKKKPVGHPIPEENLLEVLGVESADAQYFADQGYARFERRPAGFLNQTDTPQYALGDDGVVRDVTPAIEMTQDEKINAWVRIPRNRALSNSDWTQMTDAPLSAAAKAAWAEYRQTLRDMPAQYAGIQSYDEIVPPVMPSIR